MSGDIAAAGDIVTGALLARTVEPSAGDRQHGHGSDLCLNCGTRLVGDYCHACGQNGHVHRTTGAIGHEIAHGVFHFEGKIWRTLPMLAWRPGELTRRYVHGERARFVSPMALFLFSVFLLFAVVAHLPGWTIGDGDFMKGGLQDGIRDTRAQIAGQRLNADAAVAKYTRRLAELTSKTPDEDTPSDIADARKSLAQARERQTQLVSAQRFLPPPDKAGAAEDAPSNWFEEKYRHARENPKLLLYKIKTSAYKYSWALIPISLPFIWLLFPLRRDVTIYDHAVFAIYSLSFMSLLVVAAALLGWVGVPAAVLGFAWFIPPIHIYRQLKGAYVLSRLGALWRTGWMLFFACITSTIFIALLLYLGTSD